MFLCLFGFLLFRRFVFFSYVLLSPGRGFPFNCRDCCLNAAWMLADCLWSAVRVFSCIPFPLFHLPYSVSAMSPSSSFFSFPSLQGSWPCAVLYFRAIWCILDYCLALYWENTEKMSEMGKREWEWEMIMGNGASGAAVAVRLPWCQAAMMSGCQSGPSFTCCRRCVCHSHLVASAVGALSNVSACRSRCRTGRWFKWLGSELAEWTWARRHNQAREHDGRAQLGKTG